MSSEWKTSRLDAIALLNTKRRVVKGANVPFIEMAALPQHARDIQSVDVQMRRAKGSGAHFRNGDTLLARITPCLENGKTAQVNCLSDNEIGEGSTEFIVLSGCDSADNDFVYYLCRDTSFREYAIGRMEGTSGRQRVSWQSIAAYEFICPPPTERRVAAEFLSSLDDRITLLRETNATLEAIAQALFKSWFVDFDPVRAKMEGHAPEGMDEATAALFPDGFEESGLGAVPRGWKVMPIGDVISVVDFVANGSFASLKENVTLSNTPSYALYVRTTDYNSGFSGNFRFVDKQAYDFLSKTSLDGSEVIISNVGDVGTVFRPPLWLGLPMTLGSNAIALKSTNFSSYLYFYFCGAKGQHDIQSIVTGSAQMKFNKTNFRALLMAVPSEGVLQAFQNVARTLLSKMDENLAHTSALIVLRDSLLPRLISGQLRLPEAMEALEAIQH